MGFGTLRPQCVEGYGTQKGDVAVSIDWGSISWVSLQSHPYCIAVYNGPLLFGKLRCIG